MSNGLIPHQGLRGTTAPYPQVPNLLPQTYPTNFMMPGFSGVGNTNSSNGGSNKMVYFLIFAVGAAVGGLVCWKAAPYYHKIKRSLEEDF